MLKLLQNPLVQVGLTGAVVYAAWKWGGPEVKGAALGVAGVVLLNQVPVVRDGMYTRLTPNVSAAA